MKLKAVVASLVTLGLSGPVLAMQPYMLDPSFQMDVMRYQVNKIDSILDRNQPGGFDQPCGWTCRINVSGWINTDAYIANRPPVFYTLNPDFNPFLRIGDFTLKPDDIQTTNNRVVFATAGRASDLVLNNANLFVDARANNWVNAKFSLAYSSLTGIPGSQGFYWVPDSLFVRNPVAAMAIDTAYATVGNFRAAPIYFRVGKEYLPFGQYDPYAFVQSENPTQLFSQINAPTAQLGFVLPNSFYGSAYVFAGNPKIADGGSTRRIQNGGVDLGYSFITLGNNKFNIDIGYVANIADSNFLSSYYRNSLITTTRGITGLPNQKTPAWNLNADVQLGAFDANAHYVACTSDLMNPYLLSGFDLLPIPLLLFVVPTNLGRATAWGLEAGLTLPWSQHQQRLAIGYQRTTHLVNLLPQQRYYIDYLVNVNKWFDLGLGLFRNVDYSVSESTITEDVNNPIDPGLPALIYQQGLGATSTGGQLRASIKFA